MNSPSIAIIGMAGRFPGARNLDEFWTNLRDGRESIRTLSDEELRAAGVSEEELADPDYVKAAAVLDGVDRFDAAFFGLSPRDAAIMDPQHRHFLECAWEAMEHAGYTPEGFAGSVGVFAGSGLSAYLMHNLLANRDLVRSAGLFQLRQTGNDKDVLATRVSYHLNLQGPSINVQTACSTSLVAAHLACESLLHCECDMALAGGVTIEIPHGRGYVYREGEILSRDGHCRAFDAASSGTIFSSGAGIVVLRRLEDAIRDGDTIHAIILGSAINNDGARKVGYLAPSVDGQADVIAEALGVGGVPAESIRYVEAHGTGTRVGDPIEIQGLTQAFRRSTARTGFCAIGSLKTNVGHLDTAAGVAGLIKTVLALEHRQIPPSLHFETANPLIDFATSPLYVNRALQEWEGPTRRAGVTSLGIGGTNAHVVLEEAPPLEQPRERTSRPQIITLSARTPAALEQATDRLAQHLNAHPELHASDAAYTLQVGRRHFVHRRAVVAPDLHDAARALTERDARQVVSGTATTKSSVVFLFSGQGSQYVRMGAGLYEQEPAFQAALDHCAEGLRAHLDVDLRELLFPAAQATEYAAARLTQTEITQPALFSIEYAMAQWWMAHGIIPEAMLGHSIGEYAAACVAGVFSLEQGLALTAARGRLMQRMLPGAMLAVALREADIALPTDLSIAAINAPEQCVVSGPEDSVSRFQASLSQHGVWSKRLETSHAFHSAIMDPMLDAFRKELERVHWSAPIIPYLSNLTGNWITAEQATSPDYWLKHLRNTVRFSDCIARCNEQTQRVLLEVGPGQTLASLARQQTSGRMAVLTSLRHRDEPIADDRFLMHTLAQLWASGAAPDWAKLHEGTHPHRIPLPTYPFERERFWIAPDDTIGPAPTHREPSANEAASAPTFDNWFYTRRWRETEKSVSSEIGAGCWLIFCDKRGVGRQICNQLRGAGATVIEVHAARSLKHFGEHAHGIRADVRSDYDALLADVIKHVGPPQRTLHLWALDDAGTAAHTDERLNRGFYSLLFLSQALGDQDLTALDLAIITHRLQAIPGSAIAEPLYATMLGAAKVVSTEFPGLHCQSIDVDVEAESSGQLALAILAELSALSPEPEIALRTGRRWTPFTEPLVPAAAGESRIRKQGVYLITGGLGGLGLAIAERLARDHRARLVLTGRTTPDAESVVALDAGIQARVAHAREAIGRMKALGAEILTVAADVTDRAQMTRAIEVARARFGAIHGVIHAAGVIDDGPLQLKSRDSAARVLAPKVQGTLLLDELLRDQPLDFFALFSSVSAVDPPAGQFDYAAANAFLDAYAASRARASVFAIDWAAWSETGMAVRSASMHPLLARPLVQNEHETVFSSRFSVHEPWPLAEHQTPEGDGVFPGTGFLEMAAAAMGPQPPGTTIAFHNVFFLSPLLVRPGESKEVKVQLLRTDANACDFSISSRAAGWMEHATGELTREKLTVPPSCDLDAIRNRCRQWTLAFDDAHRTRQEQYFQFGPRWRNLQHIHIGTGEALAELALDDRFTGDLAAYRMHPALLDLATGASLYLITDYEHSSATYFPLSYGSLRLYRPLPAKLYSHIVPREPNRVNSEATSFDITLLDTEGRVLAAIQGFSMRRVADPAKALADATRGATPPTKREQPAEASPASQGIPSEKGVDAFLRILASNPPSSVIVSPRGLRSPAQPAPPALRAAAREEASSSAVETVLADWWQELLGVTHPGFDDDFFDLGGHSLIAVRLVSKIKKRYGLELGLSILFEARTIRRLASLIRQQNQPVLHDAQRARFPLVAIQASGTALPLFVISGLAGNVIKFHSLARHLGNDQPVYGLLPRGIDGKEPFFTRLEDIAAYYVNAIHDFQPKGPYRFVGYSFGGIVAYEVARQIVAQNGEVGLLGMFDTVEWSYMERVAKSLSAAGRLGVHKARLDGSLRHEKRLAYIRKLLMARYTRLVFQTFHALGKPLPQNLGNIEDIHTFAAANYRPRPYAGKVTLFRSTTRDASDGDDEWLGWGPLAQGGVEVHDIPSNHFNILLEPAVTVLAEKLRLCLDRKTPSNAAEPVSVQS